MSLVELLPTVRSLSRIDKLRLIQLLAETWPKPRNRLRSRRSGLPPVVARSGLRRGRRLLQELEAERTGRDGRGGTIPIRRARSELGVASLAPLLPITLLGAKSISVSGLLDTGATVNVLPYAVGEQLGAVWEQQTTPMTLSGNLAACEARAVILSGGGRRVPARSARIRLGQVRWRLGAVRAGQLLPGVRCLLLSIAFGVRRVSRSKAPWAPL